MRLILFFVVALAASGWRVDAFAQEKPLLVGVLIIGAGQREPFAGRIKALRQTLAQQGWIEGKTLSLVIRDAQGTASRFDAAAADLVRQKVDVIYADSAPAVRAAFAVTKSIPIVGVDYTNDPLTAGYAKSYNRPGGNVTGVFLDAPEFAAKWLELMREIVPNLARVVALWDPAPGNTHARALTTVAPSLGIQVQIVEVRTPEDIDNAAAAFATRPQAMVMLPSPMLFQENPRLVNLAMKQGLPATSIAASFADVGGFLAYGPDENWTDERVAWMVAKVLRGAKPADLPIERPVKFDLVINLKTAKLLNLKIPPAVVERADRLIR